MFLTPLIDTDDHQCTELGLFRPQAAVDAISPDIDPAVRVQASVIPVPVFIRPDLFQARYRAGR